MLRFSAVDLVVVVLALAWMWRICTSRGRRFPPGPPGLPIIGNLLDLPQDHEWVTYSAWHDRWGELGLTLATELRICTEVFSFAGDIVSVSALGQRVVILGSLQIIQSSPHSKPE